MNEDLRKKRRDPKKAKLSQKRYMSKFKQFNLILHPVKDADILFWLEKQDNKQKAVRELIRKSARI